MQFQVPQFIETEDKIVGPLTLKQFLYIGAAGLLCFLLFFVLQFWLWLIVTFLVGVIAASIAFIKVNGRPLIKVLIAMFNFYWHPRFYVWQRTEKADLPELKSKIMQKSFLENLLQQITTSKTPISQREKSISPSILDRVKSSKERFEMMRKLTGEREMARRVDYR